MSLAQKPLHVYPLPAKPEPKAVPQPRKAGKRSPRRHAMARFFLVFGLTLILAFMAVAWQAQIVAARRRISNVSNAVARMEADLAVVQLEVARLSSSARIEQEALARLQMSKPSEAQVITVSLAMP